MSDTTITLLDEPSELAAAPTPTALVAQTPGAIMALAIQQGASVETIERMWGLQVAYEKREAEKAYNEAFSEFKAESVRIIKNRNVSDGPLKGKKYAELFAVVNAVTPALSKHGLSASWKLTRDEKDWIEVTCTLKHTSGHAETVSMGGPPDVGGAKNAIHARASTVSYLERYTLKAITGLSEQEDDDDGRGGNGAGAAEALLEELLGQVVTVTTDEAALVLWKAKNALLAAWPLAHAEFKNAVAKRRRDLAEAVKA